MSNPGGRVTRKNLQVNLSQCSKTAKKNALFIFLQRQETP